MRGFIMVLALTSLVSPAFCATPSAVESHKLTVSEFTHFWAGENLAPEVKRSWLRFDYKNPTGLGGRFELRLDHLGLANQNWINLAFLQWPVGKKSSIKVGRLCSAAADIITGPRKARTVKYAAAEPVNFWIWGTQLESQIGEWKLTADVGGHSDIPFDDAHAFDRLEASAAITRPIGKQHKLCLMAQDAGFLRLGARDDYTSRDGKTRIASSLFWRGDAKVARQMTGEVIAEHNLGHGLWPHLFLDCRPDGRNVLSVGGTLEVSPSVWLILDHNKVDGLQARLQVHILHF